MSKFDNPYPFQAVAVVWDDAESDHGWEQDSETQVTPALVTTIGFLLKKTRLHLLIASTVSQEGGGGHVSNGRMQIPRGMVKSITIFAPATKVKNNAAG